MYVVTDTKISIRDGLFINRWLSLHPALCFSSILFHSTLPFSLFTLHDPREENENCCDVPASSWRRLPAWSLQYTNHPAIQPRLATDVKLFSIFKRGELDLICVPFYAWPSGSLCSWCRLTQNYKKPTSARAHTHRITFTGTLSSLTRNISANSPVGRQLVPSQPATFFSGAANLTSVAYQQFTSCRHNLIRQMNFCLICRHVPDIANLK